MGGARWVIGAVVRFVSGVVSSAVTGVIVRSVVGVIASFVSVGVVGPVIGPAVIFVGFILSGCSVDFNEGGV